VGGVDYYELLGVERRASTSEIKSAYRSLAKVMHPDAGGTAGTFHLLREAYETLVDPARRAHYDRGEQPAPPVVPRTARRPGPRVDLRPDRGGRLQRAGQAGRLRDFGEDKDFVPPPLRLDTDTLPWWPAVGRPQRVRLVPPIGPRQGPVLAGVGGWVVLVLLVIFLPVDSVAVLVLLWMVVAVASVLLFRLVRQCLLATLADRAFVAESGGYVVFGRPGTEPDELGQRLTANLLAEYLVPLPGVRIFHGLSLPDSVFADVDHAILRGDRLVLIESKTWLPGHYAADDEGTVWRNGHPFRGGAIRLPEGVAAYRELLPGIEVRGALVVYPSRAGEVTTGESPEVDAPPMSAEHFVREIGEWLSEESPTVDRDAFRALLDLLVA
jgi:hypothetical protein